MMWPFIRCKEAAAYILEREDHPLAKGQALNLKVHLMICSACPNFEQQILMMRKVMRRWQSEDDLDQRDASAPVNET